MRKFRFALVLLQAVMMLYFIPIAQAEDNTSSPKVGKLKVSDMSYSKITLKWSAPVTNETISGYKVLRNGIEIATVNTTAYTDLNVIKGNSYSYQIAVVPANGNAYDPCNAVTIKTFEAANFNGRASVPQTENPDGTLVPDNTTVSLLTGVLSLKEKLAALPGTPVGTSDNFDSKVKDFLTEEEAFINSFQSGTMTSDEQAAAQASVSRTAAGNIYINNQMIELARRYHMAGDNAKALALYEVALTSSNLYEGSVYYILDHMASIALSAITEQSTPAQICSALLSARNTYMRFFNYFPKSTTSSAENIYTSISAMYFPRFPVILEYSVYNTTAFQNARNAALSATTVNNSAENQRMLTIISAWERKLLEITCAENATTILNANMTVRNISAANGLAYLFPGVPYTDERQIKIQNGKLSLWVYAGHLYSFSFSFAVANSDPLSYEVPSFTWKSGVKTSFDYKNAPTTSTVVSTRSVMEFVIPKPDYPYNLRYTKDVDVFSLFWSYVPANGFVLDHFTVYRGETPVMTVKEKQALNIPLMNSESIYNYRVVAFNAEGNASPSSNVIEVLPGDLSIYSDYFTWIQNYFGTQQTYATDDPDGDGMDNYREFLYGSNPALPFAEDVMITKIMMGHIALKWNAVPGNGIFYKIMRNDKTVGTTRSTSFTDINLLPGSAYTYKIKAFKHSTGDITDWSRGLTVRTLAPVISKTELNKFKIITGLFSSTGPENYTGNALFAAISTVSEALFGTRISYSGSSREKLNVLFSRELAEINAYREEESEPLTKSELAELYEMMDRYFSTTTYENIYIHTSLIALGDGYWTEYLADRTQKAKREKAIDHYQTSLEFLSNAEPYFFAALRRIAEFRLDAYSDAQNDAARIAVLESYRNTMLSFFAQYKDSTSYMAKQIHGAIANEYLIRFPQLLKYGNYSNTVYENALDASLQALEMVPDKYLYILKNQQISAWKLVNATVSTNIQAGQTQCPGKLIIKNVSSKMKPSVIPEGVDFVDEREFALTGTSVTVPVYAGHLYEVSAVFDVSGGAPLVYKLGEIKVTPGQKMIFSNQGVENLTLQDQNAAEFVFSAGRPEVPYNLTAAVQANGTFDLSWSWTAPDSNYQLKHFEVYRGDTLVGTTASVNMTGISRAFRTDNVYSYKVRAVDVNNQTSLFSAPVNVMPPDDDEMLRYYNWSMHYFGNLAPQDADPDNDGLSNYREFILGSNPTVAPAVDPGANVSGSIKGYRARYFAGAFTGMPDFSKLTPYKTDSLKTFAITATDFLNSGRKQSFAAIFTGYFTVATPGAYRFYLTADDFANVYIDGLLVASAQKNYFIQTHDTVTYDSMLMTGTHSVRIEYLQTAGDANLLLSWAGPNFQKKNMDQGSVWHLESENASLQEVVEWQKDSDSDGVRDLIELQKGTDPKKADTDEDGLSDYEEIYTFNTDPLITDSDGDGMSDAEEVKYALSNPIQQDFNGNNSILASINGADAVKTSSAWFVNDTAIRCMNINGYASYNVPIAATGIYALKFTGRECGNVSQTEMPSEFVINCYVNGTFISTRTLKAPSNSASSMLFYLPELKQGNADVKFVWENIKENTFLQIDSIQLLALGGPDNNNSGRADWIDNRLAKMGTLNIPTTSKTSPLCVEGLRNGADSISISVRGKTDSSTKLPWIDDGSLIWLDSNLSQAETGAYSPVVPNTSAGVGNAWFSDVPLYPEGNTEISVTSSSSETAVKQIQWVKTNVLSEPSITIRKGDSLRLAAFVSETAQGNSVITVAGVSHNVSGSDAVIQKFDTAGNFTVTAECIPSGGGAATTGSLAVKVVSASFSSAPYVLLGFERTWLNPALPSTVYLDYDSAITAFSSAQGTGSKIVFYGSREGESRMLARLEKNGPVLAATTVSVLACRTHREEGYYKVLDIFRDGTKMLEGKIILSDIPADLRISLVISTAGTTFLDGTISKILTAADFDENGVCRYQILKSPGSPTATCHTLDFYQANEKLFSYKN